MLSQLQGWFADQLPNRRLYPRRPGPFRVWLAGEGEWHPLIGMDIAAGGIGVMSLAPLPWGGVALAAEVLNRRIEFAGQSVWVQEGTLETKRVWRGGFKIGSIGAEAWRTILDFCNASLPSEQHVSEPPMVRVPPHEVERLVPEALRSRIVDMLSKADRVTLLGPQPSLQFSYGGVVHHGDSLRHKMMVASNTVAADNRVHGYETVFYFDDEFNDVTIDGG
ncbi:MAG TPA: hypothetical protein VIO32_08935 [Candidatus Baltobacteraceae bacterium]